MTQTTLTLNDGRKMPQLGFGLWQVPAAITEATVVSGLEAGYRLVDGAAIYGNEAGQGAGIRASGVPRDEIFVTTKVWNSEQGYDKALRAAEASLKRLGLPWVDLLLIHWPVPARGLYLETWRALIAAR
jgi:2,5-diketo-D-gluconate reductase A